MKPIIVTEFNQFEIKQKIQDNFKKNGPVMFSQISKTTNQTINNEKVYINDYLCKHKKQLFDETKKMNSRFNIKYVWFKNGNIYIRQLDDSPIFKVNSIADLQEIGIKLKDKN